MMYWLVLCLVAFPVVASAEDVCVSIDTTTWTQDQRNLRQATAYALYFEAGEDIVPVVAGDAICFKDATLAVSTIITPDTMGSRLAADKAKREAARVVIEQRQATIQRLESELDALDETWVNLTAEEQARALEKQWRLRNLRRKR